MIEVVFLSVSGTARTKSSQYTADCAGQAGASCCGTSCCLSWGTCRFLLLGHKQCPLLLQECAHMGFLQGSNLQILVIYCTSSSAVNLGANFWRWKFSFPLSWSGCCLPCSYTALIQGYLRASSWKEAEMWLPFGHLYPQTGEQGTVCKTSAALHTMESTIIMESWRPTLTVG